MCFMFCSHMVKVLTPSTVALSRVGYGYRSEHTISYLDSLRLPRQLVCDVLPEMKIPNLDNLAKNLTNNSIIR